MNSVKSAETLHAFLMSLLRYVFRPFSCLYCGTCSAHLNFPILIILMMFNENHKSWCFHFALFAL